MAQESKVAVIGAIAGNAAIAITKFIAAAATRSSVMLTEGIHSVVDTGNGILMLVGMKKSRKPADELHPFGHGKELYFWSLIVAISIFGVGGGVSIYEGILHVLNPEEMKDPTWNYWVLGIAFLFEGISLWIAVHQFYEVKPENRGFWDTITTTKDPTIFVVIFEDSAALLGIVFAFVGVFLAHELEMPLIDGAASIAIGLLLATVAVALAYESKKLLIGERADTEVVEVIREIVSSHESVLQVGKIMTMQLGPEEVLLNLTVEFSDALTIDGLEKTIASIERQIQNQLPEIRHLYFEAAALRGSERSTSA